MTQREQLIAEWIRNNPDADEWVLSAAFNLGTVAAKAYLTEYRLTK